VLQAPGVLLGTWASWCVLAALLGAAFSPLETVAVRQAGAAGSGPLDRWRHLIADEFRPLAEVFTPELAAFVQPAPLSPALLAAVGLEALLVLFLSGGILDRYARGRPIGTASFFAACGVYFFRFLRLAAVALALGYALLRLGQALPDLSAIRAGVLAASVALAIVVDFAKARAVVEDRRSMLGALAAAIRFARRRAWRVLGLVFFNGLAILAVLRIQSQIAGTPVPPPVALLLMATGLLLAVATRLAFMASEIVFFQGELAHAGYTARPLPLWPDSPAVEGMENLRRQGR
jgi:hypothetical protein